MAKHVPQWLLRCIRLQQGSLAYCLGCGGVFLAAEMTNGFACSYLCWPCAERVEANLQKMMAGPIPDDFT